MVADGVVQFGQWLSEQYRSDGTYERVEVQEGVVSADVLVRLHVAARSYYEVRVDGMRREIQVGFGTENRTVNEDIEQMILDNGGDLDDLLGDELCDLGEEPVPMEHFFDRPAFRFIVRLRLDRLEELDDASLRKRVQAIIQACRVLFQGCVDET
jgi:hypothetical protein